MNLRFPSLVLARRHIQSAWWKVSRYRLVLNMFQVKVSVQNVPGKHLLSTSSARWWPDHHPLWKVWVNVNSGFSKVFGTLLAFLPSSSGGCSSHITATSWLTHSQASHLRAGWNAQCMKCYMYFAPCTYEMRQEWNALCMKCWVYFAPYLQGQRAPETLSWAHGNQTCENIFLW